MCHSVNVSHLIKLTNVRIATSRTSIQGTIPQHDLQYFVTKVQKFLMIIKLKENHYKSIKEKRIITNIYINICILHLILKINVLRRMNYLLLRRMK